MKQLSVKEQKSIKGGTNAACRQQCRNELNSCKVQYAGTPNIELCWDQFFACVEGC